MMKRIKMVVLGALLNFAVQAQEIEPIHSVQGLSRNLRNYEILNATPGSSEKDIRQLRDSITKFWRKNKILISRVGGKNFIDKEPLEYQIFDFKGTVISESLRTQIDRFKQSASPAQTSGALWHAQNLEIQGKGVRVFFPDKDSHMQHVGGIIEQIAPLSIVSKSPCQQLLENFRFMPISDWFTLTPKLEAFKVSNWSIGGSAPNSNIEYLLFLFQFIAQTPLIIKSAGNDGAALTCDQAADYKFFKELSKRFPGALDTNMIIVGSLDSGNGISDFSNLPGDNLDLQNNFVWALGGDVLAKVDDRYMRCSGTSMATPSVTGAAMLIAGLYPQFSKTDIKECILESARQEFFTKNPRSIWKITSQNYIPAIWGKGILDAAGALEYAKLKVVGKNKEEIKRILKERQSRIETQSASKIQSVFRKRVKA